MFNFSEIKKFGVVFLAGGILSSLTGCHTQQSIQGNDNSGNNSTSQGVNAPDASIPVSVLGGQSTAKGRLQPDDVQNKTAANLEK